MHAAEEVGQLLARGSWEIRTRFLIHVRTVAKRTSLWHKELKEIWKLSKDKSLKSARLQYFEKIARYIFIVAIRIMTRLYKPLERRTCIIPNTEALISKLDGLKSPCIVKYVKASAVFEPFKVSKTVKILYLL